MKKITVLEKLLSDGVFADEQEAKKWVLLGRVLANDVRVMSVHEKILPTATLRVKELYKRDFVGKGAFKLLSALRAFGISVCDRVCFDCGASTGGFTDRLLHEGAARVYAADAGHGMLAGKLQQDERVVNLERTNLADVSLRTLSPKPTLATIDLSYLSLTDAFLHLKEIVAGDGECVLLVKPIFETRDSEIRRTGKINDAAALMAVWEDLIDFFFAQNAALCGIIPSPVRGNTGVVEFFLHLRFCGEGLSKEELLTLARTAVDEALALPEFHKENL
ncbi:MAG: TlyA family rRNA (cytidine-2'-O)-methyltransferase [Clostridia bacterium]|nr:TlyA family rRNA (cytidine-2'-O)-methyltransferase [Clostridia bacterium]